MAKCVFAMVIMFEKHHSLSPRIHDSSITEIQPRIPNDFTACQRRLQYAHAQSPNQIDRIGQNGGKLEANYDIIENCQFSGAKHMVPLFVHN